MDDNQDIIHQYRIREKIDEWLNLAPFKFPATVAEELGITEMELLMNMPDMAVAVSKDEFDNIITEVSKWGNILVVVQNESTILEIESSFPMGYCAHGYYNFRDQNTLGGHIKIADLSAIFFVDRPFMGMESHSIQFFDQNGSAMFKLFVGRDDEGYSISEQKERYLSFKERLTRKIPKQCRLSAVISPYLKPA
jgi:hypothetical protein